MPTQDRCVMLGKLLVVKVSVVCAALLFGCAAPDLRPFAESSKTLDITVVTGGDLAIKPLTRERHWDGTKFVPPDDPNHPSRALGRSWELRRQTMEAVLVYSASLAAINEAAANRKENAAELVASVKELASNVPGLSVGTSAVGDLIVSGLGVVVEIKAWNDMKRAIEAGNPAIQLVAKALEEDFLALSNLFESRQLDQIIQKENELRPVQRFYDEVQKNIKAERSKAETGAVPAAVSSELVRLSDVLATVEAERNRLQREKSDLEAQLEEGKAFFTAATKAIEAWANAHADLVKALEQSRAPNLVVLAARAQELNEIVAKLRQ